MSTAGDQVTWQELAGVLDALDLEPGYSAGTGRAFVVLADDSLLWADATGRLDPAVPGANRLQAARIEAHARKMAAEDEAWLATLSDEARERELEARRKSAAMPDPSDHQIESYLERHGRSTDLWH